MHGLARIAYCVLASLRIWWRGVRTVSKETLLVLRYIHTGTNYLPVSCVVKSSISCTIIGVSLQKKKGNVGTQRFSARRENDDTNYPN